MENLDKMNKIMELWTEVSFNNNLVRDFFDLSSDKMLDKKIEVLTALKNGKAPSDIPHFYEVLEEYPQENNVYWGTSI